ESFGPFMVYESLTEAGTCDTSYLLDPDGTRADIAPKCGLAVPVTKEVFGEACISVTKYIVEIKQTCYGTGTTTCSVPEGDLETISDGYYRCTFWLMDIDTIPPVVDCGEEEVLIVPTGGHDCAAHLRLPPVEASDSCHDVV